jgi:hypothetical protein
MSSIDPIATIRRLRNDAPIRAVICFIALVTCAACSQQDASENESVMRAIEVAVELPAGARALEEYSRNYAMRPDGKVIGVFVIPRPKEERASELDCEVMLEDFDSRPCTDAEKAKVVAQAKATANLFGQANQSRWFDDHRELPMILDGGCDLIEIIFDPQSQLIESTECNGEA